jgi:hypothetical protein
LGFYNLDQSIIKKPSHQGRFRSLNTLEGFKNVDSKVLSGGFNGYVIGGEEDASGIYVKNGGVSN